MVQLKEPLCPCYTTALIVSIPYGTIKRKIEFAVGEVFQLFQFLMVQLKVLEQNTIAEMMSFQFLMVQLKAGMDSGNILSIVLFQFLIVRLKAADSSVYRHSSGVSIPYGTIKSQLRFIQPAFGEGVSIPYGTIKRCRILGIHRNSLVSIPYGKLKVLREIRHRVCLSRFNSLWYN